MVVVKNTVFVNLSSQNGGAVFLDSEEDLKIYFVICISCSAAAQGGGVYAKCNSLFIKSSCFEQCFSQIGHAFYHIGGANYSTNCSQITTTYCYSIGYGTQGRSIDSISKIFASKNVNSSYNTSPHIMCIRTNFSPQTSISYSIFTNCYTTTKDDIGVLLQFQTNENSVIDHLIIKDNNCSSVSGYGVLRSYQCSVDATNLTLINNTAPCLYTGTMYLKDCYTSGNSAVEGSIQNKLSNPVYFDLGLMVCFQSKPRNRPAKVSTSLLFVYVIISK